MWVPFSRRLIESGPDLYLAHEITVFESSWQIGVRLTSGGHCESQESRGIAVTEGGGSKEI